MGERCTQARFLGGHPNKVRKTSKSTLCDRCIQEGYKPEDVVPVKPNSGSESGELDTCTACRKLATELVDEVGDRLCGRCRAVFRAARALFKERVIDEREIVPTLAFAAHAEARWTLINEKLPGYFREVLAGSIRSDILGL
jgi:hypothetical protein